MVKLYHVTFGQKYRTEPHPKGMHPDGWLAVEAGNEESARAKVVAYCGTQWSFLYDDQPSHETYPKGELARI